MGEGSGLAEEGGGGGVMFERGGRGFVSLLEGEELNPKYLR